MGVAQAPSLTQKRPELETQPWSFPYFKVGMTIGQALAPIPTPKRVRQRLKFQDSYSL